MPILTFRQERFALEYLKDQNASAAAARAGYQAKNMAAQGHELLSNPAIRDRVRMEMDAMLAEIRCSAMALMQQRMKAAFFDAGKLFKGGWELRTPDELDEETRGAVEVSSVTRRSGPVVRVKQPDRHRALRALERVHERLDRLNEAYYAALEKAGQVPTLEEVEAMDAGGAADAGAAVNASTAPVRGEAKHFEGAAAPIENAEKDQVLSGPAGVPADPGPQIPAKTQVLSGHVCDQFVLSSAAPAMGAMGRGTRPSTGSGRTGVGRGISEKHQVLPGARLRLSPLARALRSLGEPALAA